MIRRLTYSITQKESGMTVQDFLKSRGYSHRMIVRLREKDGIQVDGRHAITPQRLAAGETLQICLKEEESSEKIAPFPLPFPLYIWAILCLCLPIFFVVSIPISSKFFLLIPDFFANVSIVSSCVIFDISTPIDCNILNVSKNFCI